MNKSLIALSLLAPAYALTAHAEIYMSDQEAVRLIFPAGNFERAEIELTDAEVEKIQKESGETVRNRKLVIWKNKDKDVVFVDRVLGKHEFIAYAAGITQKGDVKGIEILDYRESYGHQVRRDSWRGQFVGKNLGSQLQLDQDIKNISGATLSSAHITAGVKRILRTYDVIRSRI